MPKMCELRWNVKGETIFVNPTNVLYVRAGSPGNSIVSFENKETLVVEMDLAQTIHALDRAMADNA